VTIGVIRRHLGLSCSRCGRRDGPADDLYRLVLPDGWTFEDLGPWRERGLTIRQLAAAVRIEKTCLACRSSEDGKARASRKASARFCAGRCRRRRRGARPAGSLDGRNG
jgi:hypothetical protein